MALKDWKKKFSNARMTIWWKSNKYVTVEYIINYSGLPSYRVDISNKKKYFKNEKKALNYAQEYMNKN